MSKGIRVTVEDLETGTVKSREIWNDYLIICTGTCHVAHTQAFASGTHILTIKGRGRDKGSSFRAVFQPTTAAAQSSDKRT